MLEMLLLDQGKTFHCSLVKKEYHISITMNRKGEEPKVNAFITLKVS